MPITVEPEEGRKEGRLGVVPPDMPHGPAWQHPASPLPTEVAGEGLLVGVGQHVPPQVLLVLGGKAALAALVRAQA